MNVITEKEEWTEEKKMNLATQKEKIMKYTLIKFCPETIQNLMTSLKKSHEFDNLQAFVDYILSHSHSGTKEENGALSFMAKKTWQDHERNGL